MFVIAGGVAANKKIRSMLEDLCKEQNYKNIFHCCDELIKLFEKDDSSFKK